LVPITFTLNVLYARLDPEIHHDGIILPAAIAASEGLVPNRDFFTQYGPIGTIIQGFWIDLTSPTLYSLRILSAILITLSTLLTIKLTKDFWGLSLSSLVVCTSAIAYPTVLPAMIPWPTLITTNLILICLIIVKRLEAESSLSNYISFLLIGIILGIGFYIRLHMFAIFVLLCLTLMITSKLRKELFALILGFSTIAGSVTIYQIVNSSFDDFINQCILFPLGNYGGLSKGKASIVDICLFGMFLLYFLFSLSYFRFAKTMEKTRKFTKEEFIFFSIFFVGISSIIYFLGNQANELPVSERSFLNPVYLSLWILEHSRFLIGYSAIGFVFIYTLKVLITRMRPTLNDSLLLAIGLGTITQLYPSPDQLHVWWITPVAIVCAAHLSQLRMGRSAYPVLIGLLVMQLLNVYNTLSVERFAYKAKVYEGMIGTEKLIDESAEIAGKELIRGRSYFHCNHGIYAAPSGEYLAATHDFVDWGPQIQDKVNQPGTHFSCNHKRDFIPDKAIILWEVPEHDFYIWKQN